MTSRRKLSSMNRIFTPALICLLAALASCTDMVSDPVKFDAAQETCGPQSPSYVYFTKFVPEMAYPHKYIADTSEYFTKKNISVNDWAVGGIGSRKRPLLWPEDLSEYFSQQEIECWGAKGDQVAAYKIYVDALNALVDLRKGKEGFERGQDLYSAINLDAVEDWESILYWASVGAQPRDIFCPVGYETGWAELPQCQPDSLLAVYENGVRNLHHGLWRIYKKGPVSLRNRSKSDRHGVLNGLQGGVSEFYDLYTCDNLRVAKEYPEIEELFFERIEQDAFFEVSLGDPKTSQEMRDIVLNELKNCP